ncbi:MAG: ATP-binding protein [Proteobacteria bacterium]|nr:ATP-binding protein [Pseudomonadota bacterium]
MAAAETKGAVETKGPVATKDAAAQGNRLPAWASELRRRYLRGEVYQFILHGNVNDLVLHEGQPLALDEFLCKVLLGPSRDTIALYNSATGVRFAKRREGLGGLDELLLHRSRERVLPALERLLLTESRFALLLEYGEMLAPAGDLALYGEADRAALVTLHRWAALPAVEQADNLIVLLTETVSELHPRLAHNPRVASIALPLPGAAERRALIAHLLPLFDEAAQITLTEATAGLKLVQIRTILAPQDVESNVEQRKRYLTQLLGAGASAERIEGLARLTKGMPPEEIRGLLAPEPVAAAALAGGEAIGQMVALVTRQKREIIERECAGLLQFVDPRHGFEAVGGMDEVKRELGRVAQAIRAGDTARVPMGFLFVGPMGTGKTFVAEAFAKASGLTAVKFGSFRSKWVGSTEANLQRILDLLPAMGQVIVFIDEVDRALAGGNPGADGGTESRVIARLKEFMSDGRNRGRILFVLMTNRPDLLDTDIKRTGRLDRKIPFFYPQTVAEVQPVLSALLARHHLVPDFDPAAQAATIVAPLVGYSNADLEGVVLLAASLADSAGRRDRPALEDFQRAVADYLPARDLEMLSYMELLAVYEASNRSMLPPKYAALTPDELADRLAAARARVGGRR